MHRAFPERALLTFASLVSFALTGTSAYAQAPTKLYVAGLFYPPKVAEDAHEHVHHVEHRRHVG